MAEIDSTKESVDSTKIKVMFSLLGEIVAMFLSFIKIFKNEKK